MGHISGRGRFLDGHTIAGWLARVRSWRRASSTWCGDGWELDLGALWRSWVEAHDGDSAAALGSLLLMLDEAGLIDPDVVAGPGVRR